MCWCLTQSATLCMNTQTEETRRRGEILAVRCQSFLQHSISELAVRYTRHVFLFSRHDLYLALPFHPCLITHAKVWVDYPALYKSGSRQFSPCVVLSLNIVCQEWEVLWFSCWPSRQSSTVTSSSTPLLMEPLLLTNFRWTSYCRSLKFCLQQLVIKILL